MNSTLNPLELPSGPAGAAAALQAGYRRLVLRPALLRQAYGVEARVEFTSRQDCVVVVERACAVEDGA